MWINCFEVSGEGGGKRRLGGCGVVRPAVSGYWGLAAGMQSAVSHWQRSVACGHSDTCGDDIPRDEMCERAI